MNIPLTLIRMRARKVWREFKLTEPDVLAIRRLAGEGISYRTLGKIFRVTNQAIHSVVSRRTWKNV